MLLAAATTGNGLDPLSLIQTLGFPLAFAIMMLTGLIVTRKEHDRVVAELERERVAREQLQQLLLDEIVPAITRSNDAVARSTDLMESMARRQAGGG